MGVPKKRKSSSRTREGRSHDSLERTFAIVCPSCAEPMRRHRVCPSCGQYRGKQIVQVPASE